MDKFRIGIIGCGGMGQSHLKTISELPTHDFTAACDTFEGNLTKVCDTYKVKGFSTPEAMLDSGLVDAVLIATPHYFHVPSAVAAIERDIHVLCEKPLAVTAGEARKAIEVHKKHPKVVFGLMHQMRSEPKWIQAKKILESGVLGPMQRLSWLVTSWFRTQAYYDSGSWRATWAGEGGGVLLNQCPHQLDLLWWLAGSPSKVTANISLGKYHKIEVEDDVTAFLEYPNGATGVFVTTTGDIAGTNRLEIVCDAGKMIVEGDTVVVYQSSVSGKAYSDSSTTKMGSPQMTKVTYECPPVVAHKQAHINFADAILNGAPIMAPGEEGIHAVDLANAMIYSGLRKTTSSYPTDQPAYDTLLAELIENAKKNKLK